MPTDYTYMKNFPLITPQDNDRVVMVVQGEARTGLAGNLKDKDLRTEVENARNGQLTLSNRLSNIDTTITAETIRAQAEEQSISDDIASESNRAKLKENDLQSAINNEISRAENAENTINNTITTNKPIWDDKYTQAETDNKISAVVSGLDWKEGVHAYADLATTYPTPQKGWTVAVEVGLNNAPTYYRWNGTLWEDVGLEAIPKATPTNDGLMTKEYATKLEGIVNVKPTNYLYVSKSGNDSTGDGSANLPFLTVQHAIDIATSGTAISIFPGSYNENLTFKAGVWLVSPSPYAVYITGNHTINITGTSIAANIVFGSSTGITLSYSGSGVQNFQLYNCSINSTNGDALNITNTGTGSKIQFIDCTSSVSTSGSTARCVYTSSTSKTSIIPNRTTFKVDNPNNVCIALNGASSFTHTSDQVIGQVTMNDTSSATFGIVAMTTTSVPVLVTNSSGMCTFASIPLNTTASPAITGAGAFTHVAIEYLNTGVGGAPTLNGGIGPIGLAMSSIKLRNASLIPAAQVSAGLNNGAFEFDGTDLYFTTGNVRYKVDMGKKDYYLVDVLPTSNISNNEIYLLSTDRSINVYDGTAWHKYGGTGGGHAIEDSTNTLPQRSKLQFIGGVSLSDDSTNDTTIVNVTGGNSSDASSINNHLVDNSSYATGRPIVASGNGYTHADFNIAGIVATDGNILKASGAPAAIAPGAEAIFGYPSCTADKFLMGIQEVVAGSSVIDTHLDFSDSSKYIYQDTEKILVRNNKAELNIYIKLLLHMDDNTFKDEYNHTITNSGVVLDTNNKTFGNGSAYFNGTTSNLSVNEYTDFNFLHQVGTNGKWTINCRLKIPTGLTHDLTLINTTNSGVSSDPGMNIIIRSTRNIAVGINRGVSSSYVVGYTTTNIFPNDNLFHDLEISYDQSVATNNLLIFVDGNLIGSATKTANTPTTTSCAKCVIGYISGLGLAFIGNIDEFIIYKDIVKHTNNFIPLSQPANALVVNVPTYFKTISNLSLTTIDTITSLTMPTTIPTNTSVKVLISFDNSTNWLYHDGTGWHKFNGDITQSWASSNSNTDLQTYFTNLTMAQLKTDLSSLNIIPVSLDFIWQLNTTDLTVTPSIGQVTMVYITLSHLEAASFGGYNEQYVSFGVKKILDPTDTTKTNQMSIKNLTTQTKTIIPNVLITAT